MVIIFFVLINRHWVVITQSEKVLDLSALGKCEVITHIVNKAFALYLTIRTITEMLKSRFLQKVKDVDCPLY